MLILHYFHQGNADFAEVMQPIWRRSLAETHRSDQSGLVISLVRERRHISHITLAKSALRRIFSAGTN